MFTSTKRYPMSYIQSSASERNRLYELRTTTSLSLCAIGRELGRDVSTILRELGHNRSEEGVAEIWDDLTKFPTIFQWFQTPVHPANMQRRSFTFP